MVRTSTIGIAEAHPGAAGPKASAAPDPDAAAAPNDNAHTIAAQEFDDANFAERRTSICCGCATFIVQIPKTSADGSISKKKKVHSKSTKHLHELLDNLVKTNQLTEFHRDIIKTTADRAQQEAVQAKKDEFDHNAFANKKNLSQGLLDVSLISINAAQLKLVLSLGAADVNFFYALVTMLCASIALQVIIGLLLIVIGNGNINSENVKAAKDSTAGRSKVAWCTCGALRYLSSRQRVDILNNVTTGLTMLLTALNCCISAFIPQVSLTSC